MEGEVREKGEPSGRPVLTSINNLCTMGDGYLASWWKRVVTLKPHNLWPSGCTWWGGDLFSNTAFLILELSKSVKTCHNHAASHSFPDSGSSVSMVSIAAVPRLAQNYYGSVESDDAEDSVLCVQSSNFRKVSCTNSHLWYYCTHNFKSTAVFERAGCPSAGEEEDEQDED